MTSSHWEPTSLRSGNNIRFAIQVVSAPIFAIKQASLRSLSFSILAICVAFIFLGRGYQLLFFDAPLRALLWDESLMSPILKVFGISWEVFVGSVKNDRMIHSVIRTGGVLMTLSGIFSLAALHRNIRRFYGALIPGTLIMLLLAVLETKEHFFRLIHFFEFGIQLSAPIALMISMRRNLSKPTIRALQVMVALTFAAHGLYALNIWPIPGKFIDMTIVLLGCSQGLAEQFLMVAGILDLVLALILVLFPGGRLVQFTLLYAVLWGLATALARVSFHYTLSHDFLAAMHGAGYLTLYRLAHAGIPLLILAYGGWFKSSLNARS